MAAEQAWEGFTSMEVRDKNKTLSKEDDGQRQCKQDRNLNNCK